MRLGWRTALVAAGLLAVVALLASSVRWGARPLHPEHAVVPKELNLTGFHLVPGTSVFRAHLVDRYGGYSSGSGRLRNLLFIERSGESRWLLPDHDHVIEEHRVLKPGEGPLWIPEEERSSIASVALAKPLEVPQAGRLLLFDPTGHRVQTVADDVQDVDGTALVPEGLAILYERAGSYVLTYHDPESLAKIRETKVEMSGLR